MNKLVHTAFLVDEHPLVREAVIGALKKLGGIRIVGQAEKLRPVLPAIKRVQPDVVVVDLGLPSGTGLRGIRELKERCPGSRVIVFSAEDELVFGLRALRAGASGYVEKSAPLENLTEAVRKVLDGETYLSEAVQRDSLRRIVNKEKPGGKAPVEVLTNRELEVFTLMGKGHSTVDTARLLSLSHKTVEVHRANIRKKLGFQKGVQVLHFAMRCVLDPNLMNAPVAGDK